MKKMMLKCFKEILLCTVFLVAFAMSTNKVQAEEGDFVIENGILVKYNGESSDVVIPDGVTEIGDSAFKENRTFYTVVIPDSTKIIGKNAFYYCTNLRQVTFPKQLNEIKEKAFNGCWNLEGPLSINAKVVGKYAFSFCSIGELTILNTVSNIQENAFWSSGIKKLTIQNGVRSIGNSAFSDNSIVTVSIPASVISLHTKAFDGDILLTNISVSSANPNYSSYNGSLFNKNQTRLYFVPLGKTSAAIPKNTANLSRSLFEGNYMLTSISVNSLNTKYRTYGGCLYSKNLKTFLVCPIGRTSVKFYAGTTSISNSAFKQCSKIKSLTLSSRIVQIGNNAFENCYSLARITLSANLKKIGNLAFFRCHALKGISIGRYVSSIGKQAFESCFALSRILVHNYNRYFADYNDCLYNKNYSTLLKSPIAKKSLTIYRKTRTLGFASLSGSSYLTKVTLPTTLTTIGEGALYNCYKVKSVKMYNNVKKIYANAFGRTDVLKTLIIPKSVTGISRNAFDSRYTTIRVYKNSYAHRFAVKYKLKYAVL